jgi:hypothetical protein
MGLQFASFESGFDFPTGSIFIIADLAADDCPLTGEYSNNAITINRMYTEILFMMDDL